MSKKAPKKDNPNHDRPAGWRSKSHSNDVEPNYAVVYPADTVKTITITLAPESWQAM